MRREDYIGRHQRNVLLMLACFRPRPVTARALANVAHDGGDQTQGHRVLASLEARGFIEVINVGEVLLSRDARRWMITRAGFTALIESLPSWVDSVTSEEGR